MATIQFPMLYIPDPLKGRPLFNAKIYVGEPDLDPTIVGNQKQLRIVLEDGSKVNVVQPFVTGAGGVPVYNFKTVKLDVDGNYSLKILSNANVQKYYDSNVFEGTPITDLDLKNDLSQAMEFLTLNAAVISTDLVVGKKVTYKERITGNGGGAACDVVLASSVTANTTDIIACTGVPSLALALRKGTGYVDARKLGVIFNDATKNDINRDLLVLISQTVGDIHLNITENLFVTPLVLNNHTMLFDNVLITSTDKNKVLKFTGTGGTVFTIKEAGSFIQTGVTVTSESGMTEVVTTERLSNVRLKSLVCEKSILNNHVRYGIGLSDSSTQNPATKTNGADFISFQENDLNGCDYGALWLINAMYDNLVVNNNFMVDCKGAVIDNSLQNSTTNYEQVKAFKKSASFTQNKLINSIDFFADSTVTGSIYAIIAVSEGNYAWYDGNYCKNLQAKSASTGSCNDFYYADEKSEIGKNTVVNRFHWGTQATTNHFVNCCLKIKKAKNWSCSGYDHFYESGYFDYQVANNGVSLTGIEGDFLAIEHSVEDGPANIINIDGVRLYSKVLKETARNLYRCQNWTTANSEFHSNATGLTEICRSIADDTINSEFYKSYNVSNNKFSLPNATLTLMTVNTTNSQSIDFKCTGNTGEILNLNGNSVGQPGTITTVRSYEQDNNNFTVTGANASLISKSAIMPVMTNLSINNNIISAPNATDVGSIFGGVVSTAVQCSASCRFTTGLATAIPLDTIAGKDAAQPMESRKGQRIIKGILYDTDFTNFGIEYPFEIQYTVDGETLSYTTLKILNDSSVFTTIRSDTVSTTAVKVVTTHPNMTAEVTSGVVGTKTIQLTLTLGSGNSVRVIDVKHIKVSV